jgi:hypothetical protein
MTITLAVAPRPVCQPSRPARRETNMAIGPVQLLVLGFNHPDFQGEIIEELERLQESDRCG